MKCIYCKRPLPKGETVCPSCGVTVKAETKKPVLKRWWFWVVLLVGAAAVAGGLYFGIKALPVKEPVNQPSASLPSTEEEKEEVREQFLSSMNKMKAVSKAKELLERHEYSYNSLIDRLRAEGYSDEEAAYAADNCGADWLAVVKGFAEKHLDPENMSDEQMTDRLEAEGFTKEQVSHAIEQIKK